MQKRKITSSVILRNIKLNNFTLLHTTVKLYGMKSHS